MAQPISATPVLKGKDAERFLKRICKNANRQVYLVPTPKLVEAERLIKQISDNEKQIR